MEREGTDSLNGASPEKIRLPAFLDALISELRQVGAHINSVYAARPE